MFYLNFCLRGKGVKFFFFLKGQTTVFSTFCPGFVFLRSTIIHDLRPIVILCINFYASDIQINLQYRAIWKCTVKKIIIVEHILLGVRTVVLILYGNSEIGAHVGCNLCYLTCSRHLIRSRTQDLFSFKHNMP